MRAVDAGRVGREFRNEYVCRMLTSARVKNAVYSCKSRQEMVNVSREYLHGFASSGASGTVELLRREFWEKADASHRAAVVAPDIPLDPLVALPMLKAFAARERPCWSVVQTTTCWSVVLTHSSFAMTRSQVSFSPWKFTTYPIGSPVALR